MGLAADKMSQAAVEIVDHTMHIGAARALDVQGVKAAAGPGLGPAVTMDLGRSMIDMSMGDDAYRSNLRTVRASDAQFQQLIDMVIPEGYSRLVRDAPI